MKENKKKLSISSSVLNDVKNLIKKAKDNGLVKSHTEAFKNNPVKLEKHQGKTNYFNK